MNIHEYQAKELLRSYGVPIPPGDVVYSERAAARAAEDLGGSAWVVKAQIHAGGRGNAGGVKIGKTPQRVAELADQLIGTRLATAQTAGEGQLVQRVLVERAARIEREFYLSLIVDRESHRVVVIASAEGGVDIEEVAASDPASIHTEHVDPGVGLLDFQCRKIATAIGLANRATPFTRLLKRIYRLFRDKDCLLLEINPFIVTEDGDLMALDAKITFDDNALFRQGEVAELRDFDEEDPKEVEADGPRRELHRPGRLGRVHRQRRRARDGDDGRDRAARWAPGQLPGRGRRCRPGEDRERVPARAEGSEREGDPREHLRGDQPLRLDRDRSGTGHA